MREPAATPPGDRGGIALGHTPATGHPQRHILLARTPPRHPPAPLPALAGSSIRGEYLAMLAVYSIRQGSLALDRQKCQDWTYDGVDGQYSCCNSQAITSRHRSSWPGRAGCNTALTTPGCCPRRDWRRPGRRGRIRSSWFGPRNLSNRAMPYRISVPILSARVASRGSM